MGCLRMPRGSNLYTRWSLEMRRSGMFLPGERVGVAVSGGPDSILLLRFMSELARELGLCLSAIHFNHRLRGAESNEDQRFVAQTADGLKVEFHHAAADVARYARQSKRNLEAAARELRYRFFFSLIRQGTLDRVATAHTANDQAETVLLRLLRGAGTRGLSGIFPVLEGKVVRPFLSVTRAEIEGEIERRRLPFRVDRSNLDERFSRNRLRRQLLPLIEKDFNPQIVPALKQFADRARDDETYLEQQAAEIARPWRIREGSEEKIPARPLAQFPPALQRRVLRHMLSASGAPGGITALHVEMLRRLALGAQSGKALTLPGRIEACREFEWLVIRPEGARQAGFSFPITPPADLAIPGGVLKVRYETVEIIGRDPLNRAYNGKEWIYLDFEKLHGALVLRNWQAGDRFCPLGSRNQRRLKELFIQRKVPLKSRHLWPVLLSGDEIVWVRGFPPASRLAVSPSTCRVLAIGEEMGSRVTAS